MKVPCHAIPYHAIPGAPVAVSGGAGAVVFFLVTCGSEFACVCGLEISFNMKMKKFKKVHRASCVLHAGGMHVNDGAENPGLNQTKKTSCHKWHGGRGAKMKKLKKVARLVSCGGVPVLHAVLATGLKTPGLI